MKSLLRLTISSFEAIHSHGNVRTLPSTPLLTPTSMDLRILGANGETPLLSSFDWTYSIAFVVFCLLWLLAPHKCGGDSGGLYKVLSFFGWIMQYFNRRKNHGYIVEQLEMTSEQAWNECPCASSNDDPVNILCMDGGGMRAYVHSVVMKELQTMMGEDDDILQYFDMTCGTSAGGIAALLQNQYGQSQKVLEDSTFLLDSIRLDCFTKFSLWKLLRTGSLLSEKDDVSSHLRKRYGDTELYKPNGLKAFALCTARVHKGDNYSPMYEPFVLRSYDIPNKAINHELKINGTSKVLLWEAMAATSASPVMTEPVKLKPEGSKSVLVADGFLMSNAPVAIAISEARRLWPDRPLGVILSLGLDSPEDKFCERAVQAAKASHSPNVKYLRLASPIDDYSPGETRPRWIKKMQDVSIEHARTRTQEIVSILSHLRASGSRRPSRTGCRDGLKM